MGQNIRLPWGVSRVESSTLDLLEDEERRCLDVSILQVSVLRQMAFPWALTPSRLVESHVDYQTVVEMPQAYIDELEELEVLLSGAYDGPTGGCPVGETFVDRGNVNGFDFGIANFTANGAWQEKDLSNIVTDADATRVLIVAEIRDGSTNQALLVASYDDTYHYNRAGAHTQAANVYADLNCEVEVDAQRRIVYLISTGMDICNMVIRGWWRPAT